MDGGSRVEATWSQWKAAGLDQHSIIAAPQFTDPNKQWGNGYKPRGDYNPKPGSPAFDLRFKTFPMDSFRRDGDYRRSIISPTGRMMASFDVRERSMFVFDTRNLGSGMYFAVVRMKYGKFTRRFIVSK